MSKRFLKLSLSIMLVAGILLGFGVKLATNAVKSSSQPSVTRKTRQTKHQTSNTVSAKVNVPTILIHGIGGTFKSEIPMMKEAVKKGYAQWGLVVHVKANGEVTTRGTLKNKPNPIILVRFNNSVAGEVQDAKWIKNVLTTLKTKYDVTEYNMIGHSMGAYAAVYYEEYYSHDSNQPKLDKLVTLAGPFDGIITERKTRWLGRVSDSLLKLWDDTPNLNRLTATGKPRIIHPEYRLLLEKRNEFPSSAHVLNMYGNLKNGTNSDGTVTNISSESLAYLIGSRVASYREKMITSYDASHYGLHNDNEEVREQLYKFLWNK